MPAIYTADQLNTVSRLQQNCAAILDNLAQARLTIAEATDKGYGAGGANVITDALLQGGSAPFPQLAAADIAAAITALSGLDTALAATSRAGYRALERMRP